MKKMDMFPNNEVVYVTPPEQIDETEEICVVDYLIPRSNECIFDYTKVRRFGEDNFTMKIGGTTYEVSTHFNPKADWFIGTVQRIDTVRTFNLIIAP